MPLKGDLSSESEAVDSGTGRGGESRQGPGRLAVQFETAGQLSTERDRHGAGLISDAKHLDEEHGHPF